jgi:hypothetical protein
MSAGRIERNDSRKSLAVRKARSSLGVTLDDHCVRVAEFTLALARQEQVEHDVELVWAAAYLHDVGLMVPIDLSRLRHGRQVFGRFHNCARAARKSLSVRRFKSFFAKRATSGCFT